jgi:drug/metabolite transporter (DMT)-like permease
MGYYILGLNRFMGITFGLVSALCFGISNAYWKKAAQDADYVFLVLFRGLIAVSVFGLCWLIMAFGSFDVESIINRNATAADYLNAFMICGFCSLGLYFFLKSMKYAPVSITVALSTVNIFGILTTVLIVGERFDLIYVLAFFLAITGILLAQKLNWEGSVFQWNKGATYALLASLFWGITYPLFKFVSPKIGALPLSFILESSVTLMALFWAISDKKKNYSKPIFKKVQLRHYLVLALLLIGGTLFFNLAIQHISVFKLNLVGNFQFIVSIFLAITFYKERLSMQQILGILLIFCSIASTQYFV